MSNPFYQAPAPNYGGGFGNIMQRFNEFRQNFQGDPRQKVEELLRNGQMSQAQFNDLYAKASQIYNNPMFRGGGNPFSRLFGN